MPEPVSFRFVDSSFLNEHAPEANLTRLADPKFSEAPKTACVTRAVIKKLPFFTASRESIHRWSWNLGFGMAFTSWCARLSHAAFQQVLMQGDEWQTNFFPTVSNSFLRAFQSMKDPSSQFLTFLSFGFSSLIGIGFCITMRPLFNDSQEPKRYELLRKEFADIADLLIARFEIAKKEQNKEMLHQIRHIATRLDGNLPRIQSLLKSEARLQPESVENLLRLLKISIQQITRPEEIL